MSEETQTLVVAMLFAIFAEVTDSAAGAAAAWVVAYVGLALVAWMTFVDVRLLWRRHRQERQS